MIAPIITAALRDAWSIYRETYPNETAYAFGVYVVSEDGLIIGSCYATEEATAARAAEYEWMLGGTIEERARILRWWDSDWPHCADLRQPFARANELLRTVKPDVARDLYDDAVAALSIEGIVPAEIVLGVFGADRKALARSIERLNSTENAARWARETAAAERDYAARK